MNRLDYFVGRELETTRLSSALEDALAGRFCCVLVAGEAGIGKTRAVSEFARTVVGQGVTVLEGKCVECHETPSYGPWREAISRLTDSSSGKTLLSLIGQVEPELVSFVPKLRPWLSDDSVSEGSNCPGSRLELLRATSRFLTEIAAAKGLVVVIDNIQLADPDSLTLLEYLAQDATHSRIMVVATLREPGPSLDHPLTRLLGELVKFPTFQRIHLEGISQSDTARYVELALGCLQSGDLTERIHARTGGNPLFVVEMVRDMLSGGLDSAFEGVPAGIRDFVGRRLAALPQSCLLVLSTASAIGRRFDQSLLARLLDHGSEEDVAENLDRAERVGFVENIEARVWQFTHVLIQETLYHDIPASKRVSLHARVAELMERAPRRTPGWDGEILRHLWTGLERSGDTGAAKRLVPLTSRAAEEALQKWAPERAINLLERTLSLLDNSPELAPGPSVLAGLCKLHGRALHEAGRAEGQQSLIRAFDLYVTAGNRKEALDVALMRSHHRIRYFDLELDVSLGPVEQLRRRALEIVEPNSLDEGRLLYGSWNREDLERALQIARREGDDALETWALSTLAVHHSFMGNFETSVGLWRQVMGRIQYWNDRAAVNWFLYMYTFPLGVFGALADARIVSRELVENARSARSPRLMWRAHYASAALAGMAGDWTDCREHSEKVFSLIPTSASTFSEAFTLVHLGLVEYETGNFDKGSRLLNSFSGLIRDSKAKDFPCATAKIARITGDHSHLEELIHRIESNPEPKRAKPFEFWYAAGHVARALAAVLHGDRKRAASERKYFEGWCKCYSPIGTSGRAYEALLGLLEATEGELDAAVRHLQNAVSFCRASGYLPELAWTCLDLAEVLLQRGISDDRQEALRALEEGGAVARSLHMSPLLKTIDTCKNRIEVSPEWRSKLTPREAEVLHLVARGYKNREIGDELFISERTVANHMRNILDKLGASNRAEATAWAMLHGVDDGW